MLRNKKRSRILTLLVLVSFLCQTAGLSTAGAETLKKNIQVNLGQSIIVQVEGVIKRVSLGNPAIADYSVISKDEVMVLAGKSGNTELYIWLDDEIMLQYHLIVYDDLAELRSKLIQVLGAEVVRNIKLVLARETVILKGVVKSQYEAHQAEEVAGLFYKVMNLLEVKPEEKPLERVQTADLTDEEKARLAQEEKYREAQEKTSRIFRLRHAQAAEVKVMFDKMKSKDGYVEVDARTNSLVVIDKPAIVQHMSSILSVLDESEPQILIEAKVVEVTLGDDMRSAFDWIYETLYSGTNVLNTALNNKGVGVSNGQMTMQLDYGKISSDHFAAKILPQLTERHSRLVSNPTTVTLNRKKAKIEINDKIPYITFTPQGSTGILVPTPSTIDAGISLEVTPTVKEGNDVELDMKISVNSFIENVNFGTYGTVPRTFEKTSTNLVNVASGDTLVIGGLIRDDIRTSTAKVPWLGNLPVIKNMFRNNENNVSRTELLIFVTPKMIPGGDTGVQTDHYVDIQRDEVKFAEEQERRRKRYSKELGQKLPLPLPLEKPELSSPAVGEKKLPEIPALSEKHKVTPAPVSPVGKSSASPAKIVTTPDVKAIAPERVAEKPATTAGKRNKDLKESRSPLRSVEARELLARLRADASQPMAPAAAEQKLPPVPPIKVEKTGGDVKALSPQLAAVPTKAKKIATKAVAKQPPPRQAEKNSRYTKDNVPTRSAETRALLAQLKDGTEKAGPIKVEPATTGVSAPKASAKPSRPPVVERKNPRVKKHEIDPLSRERLEKLAEQQFKKKISALGLSENDLRERMSRREMKSVLADLKNEVSARPENGGAL